MFAMKNRPFAPKGNSSIEFQGWYYEIKNLWKIMRKNDQPQQVQDF